MAALEGLGAIAGQFSEGYRQARAQKTQQSMQQQQLDYEHANRLFQMADQVQDPHMKDTLFSSATRLLEQLESPQKAKSNPKGIGSIFGSMFGIGHQKQTPAAPGQQMGPTEPPKAPAAPPAAGPESNTFGSLGDMFGSALQQTKPAAGPVMQPAAGPTLPQVPSVDISNGPTTREMQSAATQFRPPALESPRGTPVAPPLPPQAPQGPAGPPSQPHMPMNLPIADAVLAHAKAEAEKQFPDPMQQYQRQALITKTAKETAGELTRRLLAVTDQHLSDNPGIRTTVDAARDPEWGADFRSVMDTLSSYEAKGLLDKGTLAQWEARRFQTPTQWNAQDTQTLADGSVVQINPENNRFDIKVGGPKAGTPPTFDQQVDLAFSMAPGSRGPAELNTIAGYFEKISRGDRARMSPTDQVQYDWLHDPAIMAMPITAKAQKFQSLFHPVQPTQPSVFPQPNPQTNRSELVTLNRLTGKMEPTGIMVAGSPFNAEKYMIEFQGPAVPNKAGRPEAPQKVKVYDANQLINSHRQGDPSVSVDTLRYLLRDPNNFAPGKAKEVENYIQSINPYGTGQ